ncbi:helix-turn-helix domain-containing protein [Domibacillus mangrovi]|uniref:Helix-turn-helix domain-containing protein n=1 Tax=Domibacillus mangrovi TaxID=1714354 RepID=A0A1Q5P3B8_9BACI|nr:helix-turn-helix domain-containing protein [Domibacillus mangrovi]OKL36688.1 hypothetical protein BLL40_08090 [Domibacillus mangrovi]
MDQEQYNEQIEKELGIEPVIASVFEQIEDDWILTPLEVADLIGISAISVRRWCREGKLPSYRFKRKYVITGKEFKRFVKQSKVRTKAIQSVLKL